MKYAIIVAGKVTEPVAIPTAHEGNPLSWLAKQFPTLNGSWVLVSDDAVPGATYKGPGSSTNPSIPTPVSTPVALVLSATGFMDVAIAGLKAANSSTQAAAEARFNDIIDAAEVFLDGGALTEIAKQVRYVWKRYSKATAYNKAVVAGMLALFRTAAVANITAGEQAGILAAWPEG